MKDYTDITLLIDRSGSMSNCRANMENGLQEYLTGQRAIPETRVSIFQFDSQSVDNTHRDVPIDAVGKISIIPRGGTPLYDALYQVIQDTGKRLRDMPEQDRPERVLFIVITDGHENCSRTVNSKSLAQLIANQTNKYNWEFIYLGANQDAILSAAQFGLAATQAMTYGVAEAGILNTFKTLGARTTAYSTKTVANVGHFTDAERKAAIEE